MADSFFEKLGRSLNLIDEQQPNPEEFIDEEDMEDSNDNTETSKGSEILEETPTATLAVAKIKVAERSKKKIEVQDPSNKESVEEGRLTIDVYETPHEIIIKSTIAGVDPDDLDIDITSDSVSIRGERSNNEQIKTEDYFYQECYWGAFSRSIILPTEIDADKADASLENGILTITLPKLSKSQQKKLKVRKLS